MNHISKVLLYVAASIALLTSCTSREGDYALGTGCQLSSHAEKPCANQTFRINSHAGYKIPTNLTKGQVVCVELRGMESQYRIINEDCSKGNLIGEDPHQIELSEVHYQ